MGKTVKGSSICMPLRLQDHFNAAVACIQSRQRQACRYDQHNKYPGWDRLTYSPPQSAERPTPAKTYETNVTMLRERGALTRV